MLLVFGFAGNRSLKTRTNMDWFLGGRTLPFWMVGVSMFATSVDGGEYIAMNGATYKDGLVMISGLIFGVGVGGVIAAFLVVPDDVPHRAVHQRRVSRRPLRSWDARHQCSGPDPVPNKRFGRRRRRLAPDLYRSGASRLASRLVAGRARRCRDNPVFSLGRLEDGRRGGCLAERNDVIGHLRAMAGHSGRKSEVSKEPPRPW